MHTFWSFSLFTADKSWFINITYIFEFLVLGAGKHTWIRKKNILFWPSGATYSVSSATNNISEVPRNLLARKNCVGYPNISESNLALWHVPHASKLTFTWNFFVFGYSDLFLMLFWPQTILVRYWKHLRARKTSLGSSNTLESSLVPASLTEPLKPSTQQILMKT